MRAPLRAAASRNAPSEGIGDATSTGCKLDERGGVLRAAGAAFDAGRLIAPPAPAPWTCIARCLRLTPAMPRPRRAWTESPDPAPHECRDRDARRTSRCYAARAIEDARLVRPNNMRLAFLSAQLGKERERRPDRARATVAWTLATSLVLSVFWTAPRFWGQKEHFTLLKPRRAPRNRAASRRHQRREPAQESQRSGCVRTSWLRQKATARKPTSSLRSPPTRPTSLATSARARRALGDQMLAKSSQAIGCPGFRRSRAMADPRRAVAGRERSRTAQHAVLGKARQSGSAHSAAVSAHRSPR